MIADLETLISHRKIDLSKISHDYHKHPLFRLRRNIYGKIRRYYCGRFFTKGDLI